MTVIAWYMDDSDEDQRATHQIDSNHFLSVSDLDKYGVVSWSGISGPGNYYILLQIKTNYNRFHNLTSDDPRLDEIKKERGYTYTDIVTISPDKLPDYDTKIKNFYREHIHYDEEIRFILEGNGYFDIRDEQDRWIRISLEKGDMIVLPEGIFHRFTCDANNYAKAMVSNL
jgi:1,2-dihydroxy-3-keto-5-methylthiopentene dioxygenase